MSIKASERSLQLNNYLVSIVFGRIHTIPYDMENLINTIQDCQPGKFAVWAPSRKCWFCKPFATLTKQIVATVSQQFAPHIQNVYP